MAPSLSTCLVRRTPPFQPPLPITIQYIHIVPSCVSHAEERAPDQPNFPHAIAMPTPMEYARHLRLPRPWQYGPMIEWAHYLVLVGVAVDEFGALYPCLR